MECHEPAVGDAKTRAGCQHPPAPSTPLPPRFHQCPRRRRILPIQHRHHSTAPLPPGRRNRHGHHDHYDANNNGHHHNDAGDGHDANDSPSTRSASSWNGTWLLLP